MSEHLFIQQSSFLIHCSIVKDRTKLSMCMCYNDGCKVQRIKIGVRFKFNFS